MDETRRNKPTAASVFAEYDRGRGFNGRINLDDTVETNENFFIGKQWEGVEANGLPTPVFNFLKRVVLFQVASILSDNIKMNASPLAVAPDQKQAEQVSELVSREFDALFEHNKIGSILREYMRNAAVDGDGCTYTYWDPDVETGQQVKGALVTEIIENTRVFFGNPNERRVQRQPYIIIESREMLDSVRHRAEENGADPDLIRPDADERNAPSRLADERVTVLLRLWKDFGTGTVHGCEATKDVMLRQPWDLGIRLYPITWLNWDYIQDCYHGQAMITGLIPNQIFVNKTYAMVQLSLMQSAFPKVVYDKTRVAKWTNQAGVAIGVNGGDVNNVARIIEPAQVSPQIAQFIDSTISYTQTFQGATSAATGEANPDNTSAIIALQRASAVPSEITKQNLYQSVEELGSIYLEFMIACYGRRRVKAPTYSAPDKPDAASGQTANLPGMAPGQAQVLPGMAPANSLLINPAQMMPDIIEFDFGTLRDMPMSLKLDVGASSYWSEIAAMKTLDNLLMQGKIDLVDYLERVPAGYIANKQELIDKLNRENAAKESAAAQPAIPGGMAPGTSAGLMPGGASPLTAGMNTLGQKVFDSRSAV